MLDNVKKKKEEIYREIGLKISSQRKKLISSNFIWTVNKIYLYGWAESEPLFLL